MTMVNVQEGVGCGRLDRQVGDHGSFNLACRF